MYAGLRPYGLDVAASGAFAAVANIGRGAGDHDTISLIDLRARPPRVVETVTVGQTPEGIKISPDSSIVAVVMMNGSNKAKDSPFYSDNGKLVLFRVSGTSLTKPILEQPVREDDIHPRRLAPAADHLTQEPPVMGDDLEIEVRDAPAGIAGAGLVRLQLALAVPEGDERVFQHVQQDRGRAPVSNWLTRSATHRGLLECLAGIDHRRPLPGFAVTSLTT